MISCKEYVTARKERLKEEIDYLEDKPCLVVFQVDDDSASNSYIKGKKRDASDIGVKLFHIHIDSKEKTQTEFEQLIEEYNCTPSVNGIIIQLPIPDKYDFNKLLTHISREKDVDGFRKDSCFEPCTIKGIIDWLKFNDYDLVGKNAVVLGRGSVGLPLTNRLIKEGCTVTCCHSKTDHISKLHYLRDANIVVSAVGKAKSLSSGSFPLYSKKLDVIVDVGINRDENGKICGDVDPTFFEQDLPNTYLTMTPGGTGLLTRLALMENVYEAYKINEKYKEENDENI